MLWWELVADFVLHIRGQVGEEVIARALCGWHGQVSATVVALVAKAAVEAQLCLQAGWRSYLWAVQRIVVNQVLVLEVNHAAGPVPVVVVDRDDDAIHIQDRVFSLCGAQHRPQSRVT